MKIIVLKFVSVVTGKPVYIRAKAITAIGTYENGRTAIECGGGAHLIKETVAQALDAYTAAAGSADIGVVIKDAATFKPTKNSMAGLNLNEKRRICKTAAEVLALADARTADYFSTESQKRTAEFLSFKKVNPLHFKAGILESEVGKRNRAYERERIKAISDAAKVFIKVRPKQENLILKLADEAASNGTGVIQFRYQLAIAINTKKRKQDGPSELKWGKQTESYQSPWSKADKKGSVGSVEDTLRRIRMEALDKARTMDFDASKIKRPTIKVKAKHAIKK